MKTAICLLIIIALALPLHVFAQTNYIEVNAPGSRLLKLAVDTPRPLDLVPKAETAKELSEVLLFDTNMSGIASAESRDQLPVTGGITLTDTDFVPWMTGGYDLLIRSAYSIKGEELTVEFRLFDVINSKLMTAKR